jgi:hypothetical protein
MTLAAHNQTIVGAFGDYAYSSVSVPSLLRTSRTASAGSSQQEVARLPPLPVAAERCGKQGSESGMIYCQWQAPRKMQEKRLCY